jgi:ComF family protein
MVNLRSIFKGTRPYIEAVLNFIYPPFCVICQVHLNSDLNLVCEQCWNSLPRIKQGIDRNQNIFDVDNKTSDVSCVISVWAYTDQVQKIIHEMKYFQKKSLAAKMGDEMAVLVLENHEYLAADFIIPVPLHKTKLRERGFNQSLHLANRIAVFSKIPVESNILKRIRYTKSQSKLSAADREKNVERAFAVTDVEKLLGKKIILVDDVLTTGSTVRECAKVLRQAGVSKILAITAAKAIRL